MTDIKKAEEEIKGQKPSEVAKAHGFSSLEEVARILNEPPQNLINWHQKKPWRFLMLLRGAKSQKQQAVENAR